MQNKLSDLNNHLFAELERLSDEELTGEKLHEEIGRAKAIANIATQIVLNGSLVLKAKAVADNSVSAEFRLPTMLED